MVWLGYLLPCCLYKYVSPSRWDDAQGCLNKLLWTCYPFYKHNACNFFWFVFLLCGCSSALFIEMFAVPHDNPHWSCLCFYSIFFLCVLVCYRLICLSTSCFTVTLFQDVYLYSVFLFSAHIVSNFPIRTFHGAQNCPGFPPVVLLLLAIVPLFTLKSEGIDIKVVVISLPIQSLFLSGIISWFTLI